VLKNRSSSRTSACRATGRHVLEEELISGAGPSGKTLVVGVVCSFGTVCRRGRRWEWRGSEIQRGARIEGRWWR
jgi:hypothetical protein